MKVSVVIPVLNREELLLRALASVYAQTLTPEEVIVVDDGSDVSLVAVLEEKYPQVKLLRQPNSGVSRARNFGVNQASGDWIAFLDSDDEWQPKKLQAQAKALDDSGLLLCHTDEIWIRNGVRVNPHNKHKKFGGDIFEKCLPLCLISPSSALINKQLFNKIGGFDEKLPACEDYDLWLRITLSHQVEYIDLPLIIKYGGHYDQLSQKHWGMDRFRIYAMEKCVNHPELSDLQKSSLLNELITKCDIFSKGALKNNNPRAYKIYTEKYNKYKNLL